MEFDWVGTCDPSAWLAAPAAIALLREVGLEAVFAHNHALAWHAARRLSERFDGSPPAPESMIGTMATVALLFEDGIEVQLHAWRDRLWVRVSAQVYVEEADLERLADAVLSRLAVC